MFDQIVEIPLPGRTIGFPDRGNLSTPRMKLPSYVAGPENRLVASTVCRLLKAESCRAHGVEPAEHRQLPRLLSLFGPTGTGKTHLARGLVRHWQVSCGDAEAGYLTAQDFRQQFNDSIDRNCVSEFRRSIRTHTLLAIDDLHRIPEDLHLMQELRHTIDALEEAGATLLVTSPKPVHMLPNLPADVRSRLACGLMLQLAPPGNAARVRIVTHISSALQRTLSDDAVHRLADSLHGTASQLLAALFELEAERRPDGAGADDGTSLKRGNRQPSLREIIAVVAKYYKISQKQLKSASRKRCAVLARATVVALARELTSESYEQIGRALGGRDHTTIMHNCQRMEQVRQHDFVIQETLDDLRRILLYR